MDECDDIVVSAVPIVTDVRERSVTIITDSEQVLPADPQRYAVIFSIVGMTEIQLATSPVRTGDVFRGIRLTVESPRLEISYRIHGDVVKQPWYANFSQTGFVFIMEFFKR